VRDGAGQVVRLVKHVAHRDIELARVE